MFWNLIKAWFTIIVFILVVGAVGFLGKLIFFPGHVANTAVNSMYDITDKTLKADNVLDNYEWFKQQYEDYLAIQTKITQSQSAVDSLKELAGDRAKWTFEDKTEYSRLSSIVDGLKYQAEDMKSEYNAKSKMLNRNLFKDRSLPYQLN